MRAQATLELASAERNLTQLSSFDSAVFSLQTMPLAASCSITSRSKSKEQKAKSEHGALGLTYRPGRAGHRAQSYRALGRSESRSADHCVYADCRARERSLKAPEQSSRTRVL